MHDLTPTVETLGRILDGIDAAVQAHLRWNQRLLRCAFLQSEPDGDMVRPRAHELCRFGLWLAEERPYLDRIDAGLTATIGAAHQAVHDSVRGLCAARLRPGADLLTPLSAYESSQRSLIACLAELKHAVEGISGSMDVLTGLPLRHGLAAAFAQCRRDARREAKACVLAMIDVDHFKKVNDTFGHPVGDMALVHVAATLRSTLRESDPLFRFGGEEFLAMLRCEDADAATQTVDRMLEALRTSAVRVNGQQSLTLTATVGITEVSDVDTLHDVVARADYALLQGKLLGRDQQVWAMAGDEGKMGSLHPF